MTFSLNLQDYVINVKRDWGAVGNGVADDTAAIQAAFDAAFGTAASPHGNGGGPSNIPVFFPAGTYKITSPIVVTAVWGGRIFGAGEQCSIISYQGTIAAVNAEGWCPALWLNGCNFCTIDGISVVNQSDVIRGDTGAAVTVTISIASPGVVTEAGHTLVNGDRVRLYSTGSLPTGLTQGSIYYVVNAATDTYKLSATSGGSAINTSGSQSGTHTRILGHSTVCIWFGPDGANGGSSAHANTLINISTSTASYGVIHGSTNSAANSENTYIGCNLSSHEQVGMYLSGANTLNIRVYGGGISACGVAGIKTNNSATIPIISNTAFDGNFVDIDLAASGICVIDGVRTESPSFVKSSSQIILNCCSQASLGDSVTGSTSGTTLTVSAMGSHGNIIKPGMVIYGTDSTNSLPISTPTRVLAQLTGTTGGTGTYALSAAGSPGNISSTTFTIRPVFLEQVGAAVATLNGCGSAFDPAIIGAGNSTLSIRDNGFFNQLTSAISADLFKWYAGFVLAYDVVCLGAFTVANLPTANARFKGVRTFVTDSTVAASGNFAAIVAGGSTNTVPVFCDGTNWRIG